MDKDIEAINASLAKIGDQLKAHAERAEKEIKANAQLSKETRASVDELLAKQGELQARLATAEQLVAKIEQGGGARASHETAGQQFVNSDEFKAFAESGVHRNTRFTVRVNAAITSDGASAGDLVEPQRIPGIQMPGLRRLTVRDLISPGQTSSNLIQYIRETGFTNNAATVAEGGKKPESNLTFELTSTPVVKIAHFVKASTEILMDAPMLQSYIDQRLRYGLKLVEEAQLLHGSGVGNNLNGIMTQATAYSAPISITGATHIDKLRLALLQSELAEFPATGIVLHPSDWTAIELTKDDNGGYIFANPQSLAQPALWGRPVVTTQAMDANDFLVGAFQLGAQVFDRMQDTITIATENEDDFVNNLVTILAEERLGMAVYRPEAFIKGELATE